MVHFLLLWSKSQQELKIVFLFSTNTTNNVPQKTT